MMYNLVRMQNAECGTRNDLATLRFAHKERMISAERGTTSLHYVSLTRKS